ncbi:zinc knuckle protein [Citrus sinensis]|uniref:Zinc knuckle protein n=1 Tax=Citrus sinensis TaxID=2711 RepID=A0ACB8JR34_CITSI|nr:zinc knuckle protein [Citrus sinensis]
MDSEELIRRCEAISLKSEEDDMIDFAGKMKAKGEKIAAHCLIGKIYHTRGVSQEGLRAAMQQVWRSVKEVKVESMGENIFIFKFASEGEKKRILHGGPWHFNNWLMVLTEPTGIGDIKQQTFTYTSFWVQIHNALIMCMDKDIMKEIGQKIGKVEEVETDETGECLGSFARVRISIDITQPLKERLLLKLEDERRISLRVAYEKLPEFCFCCGLIGHQYKKCLDYGGQPKEELVYGAWMKALTRMEKAKQKINHDHGIERQKSSSVTLENQEQPVQKQMETGKGKPSVDGGNGLTQLQTGHSTMPMEISQVEGSALGSLMKMGETDLQKGTDCNKGAEIAGRELLPGKMSTVAGTCNQAGQENEMVIENENMGTVGLDGSKNDMAHPPKTNEVEMARKGKFGKFKIWKSQARSQATKEDKKNGPFSLKRPIETQERLSPNFKKQKMFGHTDAPVAKLRLSHSPITKNGGRQQRVEKMTRLQA